MAFVSIDEQNSKGPVAFSTTSTYRRSAAGARGSAASDKPVCCNALLASVTVRASTQVDADSGRSRRPEERVGRCDTPPRKETCVGAVGASRGGVASKIPGSPGSCRKRPVFPTERRPPPSDFARGTNVRHQVPPRQPRARSQAAGSPLTISSRRARKSSPDTAVTSPRCQASSRERISSAHAASRPSSTVSPSRLARSSPASAARASAGS